MFKKFNKSIIFALTLVFIMSFITGCNKDKDSNAKDKTNAKPVVAVSIVPEETFVKEVAGDLVDIVTLIPPSQSAESYSPTPKDMQKFSEADLYFAIGVPAEENNIMPKISDFNKDLKVVNLDKAVSKEYKDLEFAPGSRDPHIWLSPKRVKVMVDTIASELSTLLPEHKATFEENAKNYNAKLTELDNEIRSSIDKLDNKNIIVYHPAFNYYAEDYGITMHALEEEGKEATPHTLQDLIDFAKKEDIKVIFYQAEVDSKQAKSFAESIGGVTEMVEPLAPNYIDNLKKMTDTFLKVKK
ncbi:zinc transport system substrate-binding protein [Clostridium collagenovorans DSM 3089]|uniref:Zinc transport system substrate-binding protein n=1 Tax=Clostridium collagenovorans DSM 3089 TaxID=1121306 RepID=A0A1M5Y9H3_9CLOT|nr:zinc ABC transporter substrate-binding protein [Clostridium collagenovorans]SHI08596.1 zinc transport system substrate-binding protein [Clostridium collagenovorans DSM 3089]